MLGQETDHCKLAMKGELCHRGKFWSTIRAATDPLFHAQALASYAPVMHSAIEQLLGRIDIAKGAPIEISQPLREMSLQIIGSAAFG